MVRLKPLQHTVRAILEHAEHYQWSVQGFGMLRLYIGKEARLHIWDSTLRYPGVSMIHNHSWNLTSTVVSGRLLNVRYLRTAVSRWAKPYHMHRLITGYSARPISNTSNTYLDEMPSECYVPGTDYIQRATEIHQTLADNGTITLMERTEDEQGQADVFWPLGEAWGDATPRAATIEEVRLVTKFALDRL